ncbi:MAG: DMT family transporter [Planctomycetota bacterium]
MVAHVLMLMVGVFACSTAVIMVKESTVHPVALSAYRLLIAAVLLTPMFLRDVRRHRAWWSWRQLRRALLPGLVLGVHFISWIAGARLTLSANASLVVNMVPIVMPFLLYWMIRERLTRGEWAGTASAMAGLVILATADAELNPAHFLGDVVCFLSMLVFAVYLALGRRNRDVPGIWLYLVPLYYIGGLICLAASTAFVNPLDVPAAPAGKPAGWNLLMALGLGVIPTIIGHSTLNFAMKHLRGQFVSIANVGQFIFAGTMAFFLRGEVPNWQLYPAASLIVAGAYLAIRPDRAAKADGPSDRAETPAQCGQAVEPARR